jgi:phosphopantetheinyl transferase (holo-ACP synthase)
MQSIGNDIIALNAIDVSRTNTPRFYTKILAESEQQLYHSQFSAMPFHYFVWLLWSVKESAYKCLQRQQPDLLFSPVGTVITQLIAPLAVNKLVVSDLLASIGIEDDTCIKSTITFQSQTLYARSVIYGDELIHTVASDNPDFAEVNWGIKHIEDPDPDSQSSAVREFLLNRLTPMCATENLEIQKHVSGYPFVTIGEKQLAVSLSHHANWVGYAYNSPNLCKA